MARTRRFITKDITTTSGNVSYFDPATMQVVDYAEVQFNGRLDVSEFRERAEELDELKGKQVIVTDIEQSTSRYKMSVEDFIKHSETVALQLTLEDLQENESEDK